MRGELRFFTALHVLEACGIHPPATSGILEMCDEQMEFLLGPKSYRIRDINWDNACDLADFACDFPGNPFAYDPTLAHPGVSVTAYGYLIGLGGERPDCGEVHNVQGMILSRGEDTTGACDRLSLSLLSKTPDLDGMSGGPVTVDVNGSRTVVGLLNGAPQEHKGRLFVATVF
jgi:hypothetical protein